MNQAPPDIVKWALLIGVPLVMGLFVVLGPVRILLARVPRFRALMSKKGYVKTELGMDLSWDQKLKLRGFDFDRVAKVLVREMTKPGLLHAQRCMEQIASMSVEVMATPLESPARVRAGIGDLNHDGKEDIYTGLTFGPMSIQIGAFNINNKHMVDKDGFVIVERTAFSYELLNALIWASEGYEVSIAEGALPGLADTVENEKNAGYFARRKQFDDVFAKIDWTQS